MKAIKMLPVVMGVVLLASSAMATTKHPAPCGKVRAALDSGKTQQQVAKDLKVSVDHVKHCTMQNDASAK